MIYLQLFSPREVSVSRESIHGMIHGLLTSQYHDNGVGVSFKNGDAIKAHTFLAAYGKQQALQPFALEIRASSQVEQSLIAAISGKSTVTINNTEVNIDMCQQLPYKIGENFQTYMPVIVRKSLKNSEYSHYAKKGQRTVYLTYQDDPCAWLDAVSENLIRRATAIMGPEWTCQAGNPEITVLKAGIARSELLGNIVKGTRGTFTISTPWNEFAFNFSLGERTTYGFGALKEA